MSKKTFIKVIFERIMFVITGAIPLLMIVILLLLSSLIYSWKVLVEEKGQIRELKRENSEIAKKYSSDINQIWIQYVRISGFETSNKLEVLKNRISAIENYINYYKKHSKSEVVNELEKSIDVLKKLIVQKIFEVDVFKIKNIKENKKYILKINDNQEIFQLSKNMSNFKLNKKIRIKWNPDSKLKIELYEKVKGYWSTSNRKIASIEYDSPISIGILSGTIELSLSKENYSTYKKDFPKKIIIESEIKNFSSEEFRNLEKYIWPGIYWEELINSDN